MLRDFRALRERLWADGLFDSRPYWHLALYIRIVMMWAAGVACVVAGRDRGSVGLQLFGGALIGFFWQQFALFAHDGCHNSLTHVRATDYMVMVCSTGLLGISPTWWKDSHNHHHVITNSIDCDQDIQHLPFLSVSEKYFGGVLSKYHRKVLPWDAFSKFMVSRQHQLYIPIMMLARQPVRAVLRLPARLRRGARRRDVQDAQEARALQHVALLRVVHVGDAPAADGGGARAVRARLARGQRHAARADHHLALLDGHVRGLPVRRQRPRPARAAGGLGALAARVDDGRRLPALLGLVPRRAQPALGAPPLPADAALPLPQGQEEYIKPFCAAHKLHHHNPGFWGSAGETLACLKAVALKARAPRPAPSSSRTRCSGTACARG